MHPAAPCCSALAYAWYARFSRLALRAPRSSRCVTVFTNKTTKLSAMGNRIYMIEGLNGLDLRLADIILVVAVFFRYVRLVEYETQELFFRNQPNGLFHLFHRGPSLLHHHDDTVDQRHKR